MKKAPIVIINDPPSAQVVIEQPNLYAHFLEGPKAQINIGVKKINVNVQSPTLNYKFNNPIINNHVCTRLIIKLQSQILREKPQETCAE